MHTVDNDDFFEQAQQAEPWEKFCDSNCVWTDHHPDCKLAQQAEPVIDKSAAIRIATALGWKPPRQPLTDEEILDVNMSTVTKLIDEPIICDTDHNIIQFARAIEAAHGITGEQK